MHALLRLRGLSARDAQEQESRFREAQRCSPSERLAQALELSDLARELARSVGAAWVVSPAPDLSEKAWRHPLGR